MQELKITSHTNYTDIHQLLYKEFKNKLITFLILLGILIFFWWSKDFIWIYILLPALGLLTILVTVIANIIEYGPKRLICQLSYDEIITLNGYHVPIKNIKTIEFLAKSSNHALVYDITLVLKTTTKVDLFVEISTKNMYTLHNIMKGYTDFPFTYIKAGGLLHDKLFTKVEEIL